MVQILTGCLIVLLTLTAQASEKDSPPQPFSQLQSVQAFDQLMLKLLEMRDVILSDAVDDREAAEGMRFLLRTMAMAQDVSGDGYAPAPHFGRMDTQRRKVGGDNPDGEYDNLVWSSNFDYKISGNIGSVDSLSFTVLERLPSGKNNALGYVNESTIGADANGNFTLWLTKEKPEVPGHWIQTGSLDGTMLVRQYFGDRKTETPATYRVEVLGRQPFDPLPPSTDEEVADSIRATTYALQGIGLLHRYVSPSITDPPNRFVRRNSDDFGSDISSEGNLYMIGTYAIESDEALVVEVDPLDVDFWNLAIESPWHESVDYRERKTSRTHDDITVDSDGKVRFLIAHARADHPNYLETGGHSRGFMTFRWVGDRDTQAPLPMVTRLPLQQAIANSSAERSGGDSTPD